MSRKQKIFSVIGALALVAACGAQLAFAQLPFYPTNSGLNRDSQGNAPVLIEGDYAYINLNNSTTSVKTAAGILHSVVIDTPGVSSVITLWDTTGTVPVSKAVGTITVGVTSSTTSTVQESDSVKINGLTVATTTATGTSMNAIANQLVIAINASSSVLGVTAATSSNVITVSSTLTYNNGNQPFVNNNFASTTSASGITFAASYVPATNIIAQMTLPATTTYYAQPQGAYYDTVFFYGLMVTQTGATSTFTISYQ